MALPKNEDNKIHAGIIFLGVFWGLVGCIHVEVKWKEIIEYWTDIYENGIYPSKVVWDVNMDTLGLSIPYDADAGKYVLPHSWIGDAQFRKPILTWVYNGRNPMETFDTNRAIGLFMPQFSLWIEQGILLSIQVSLGLVCAYIIYNHIILPQKQNNQQGTTTKAMLVAFGAVIPFWLCYPMFVLKHFQIDSKIVRYVIVGVTPSLSLFRTTEALNGGAPSMFTTDLWTYMIYFVCPNTPIYDKQKKEFKKASLFYKFKKFCVVLLYWLMVGFGFTMTDLYPRMGVRIGRGPPYDYYLNDWLDPWWILSTKSTFIGGMWVGFFFYTMAFTGEIGQLTTILLTGYEVEPLFENPIWKTRTASDFWGKRWNLMIQRLLKRGVFSPSLKVFEQIIPLDEEEKLAYEKYKQDKYAKKQAGNSNSGSSSSSSSNGITANGNHQQAPKDDDGKSNKANGNKLNGHPDNNKKDQPTKRKILFQVGGIKIDKRGLQKGLAMMCTFALSGIYHEWLVYLTILLPTSASIANGTVDIDRFPYLWGGNISYFAWQGLCILGEVTLFPKSWFSGGMPLYIIYIYSYIISINGTFFLAPYVHTTFFRDQFPGYLMVQPLPLPPCS